MKIKKDRGTAIILAVLFAGGTWIYTYKYDAWKLWLNLVLCIVSFGLWSIPCWIWAVIDSIVKDKAVFEDY